MTVAEFRCQLETASIAEQNRRLAKLFRETRDAGMWKVASLAEVWRRSHAIAVQTGRDRAFWEFLLDHWHSEEANR
jgi:hypothetical protein